MSESPKYLSRGLGCYFCSEIAHHCLTYKYWGLDIYLCDYHNRVYLNKMEKYSKQEYPEIYGIHCSVLKRMR